VLTLTCPDSLARRLEVAIRGCGVVAIEGAHGSGKSTLVSSAVGHFRAIGVNASGVSERARDSPFFEAALVYGGPPIDEAAELHILGEQIAAEQVQAMRSKLLIVDRSLMNVPSYWTVRFASQDLTRNLLYTDMRTFVESYCQHIYDLVFLVSDHYVDPADELRETDESFRVAVASQLESDLAVMRDRVVRVPKGLAPMERLTFVTDSISSRVLKRPGAGGNES
jgi:nicotinamide riboside kinase